MLELVVQLFQKGSGLLFLLARFLTVFLVNYTLHGGLLGSALVCLFFFLVIFNILFVFFRMARPINTVIGQAKEQQRSVQARRVR